MNAQTETTRAALAADGSGSKAELTHATLNALADLTELLADLDDELTQLTDEDELEDASDVFNELAPSGALVTQAHGAPLVCIARYGAHALRVLQ